MGEINKAKNFAENIISQLTSSKKKESPEEQTLAAESKVMEELVIKQREYFLSGETRDTTFRIQAPKKLYASILSHEKDISIALREDLFKSPFESYATEIGLVLKEIKYLYKHLKKWSRTRRVPGEL